MMEQYLVTPSYPLVKALALNSQAQAFATLVPLSAEPTDDGVIALSRNGVIAPQLVYLVPYCEGNAGDTFSVRLVGWRLMQADNPKLVWVGPLLLAEFLCVAGELPGPAVSGAITTPRLILPSERFCEQVTLTNGSVGPNGEVVSPGSGSGQIGFAAVNLRGCQKAQFDFQYSDQVPMNCLWAAA